MQRFSGRTAIVTGGAQGIGQSTAMRLMAEGAQVLVADIQPAETAAILRDQAGRPGLRYLQTDVTDPAAVQAMVDAAVAAFGRLDILVANVGVARHRAFVDLSPAEIEDGLRINLVSMILCGQAAIRQMRAQGGGGAIVNMSSVNAVMAMPGYALYNIAKGGIEQLTRVMALEHATDGIRVNAVGPGTIMTEMARSNTVGDPDSVERVLSRTPMGRFGAAEEVAAVIAFLASDDAAYVTGETVFADGGRRTLNYVMPPPAAG